MKRFVPAVTVFSLATGSVGAATPTIERDTYLSLHLTAAVDSNCDGELSDETKKNAEFSTEKLLEAGQCLVYRTDYSNKGDFSIRKVEVRTPVPDFMVYQDGSASHVETPPGLLPVEPKPPEGGRGGDLVWPFKGGLAPGESGRVEFIVKLQPIGGKLDFIREKAE